MPFEELSLDENDMLDADALTAVKPKEQFEGYTGNEGMTLDRWYRHAAIVLWPERSHYHVVCNQNLQAGIQLLGKLIAQWRKASTKNAAAKLEQCTRLARAILDCWQPARAAYYDRDKLRVDSFFPLVAELDNCTLISEYIAKVLLQDVSLDPGDALAKACAKHGWPTFAPALTALFQAGNAHTLLRNAQVLERLACAKPSKRDGWHALCEALGQAYLTTLEKDDATEISHWRPANENRVILLAGLIRAFLASEQQALLARLVKHILAFPSHYPLEEVQLPALEKVQSWLKKNMNEPSMPMSDWLAQCRIELEKATAEMPAEPTDFRRSVSAKCSCKWCQELNRFLADPQEEVHRIKANEEHRRHVENAIRGGSCDVDCATDKKTSPHTLVCKKNTKSYHAALKKYHEDLKHLEKVRAIEAALPE